MIFVIKGKDLNKEIISHWAVYSKQELKITSDRLVVSLGQWQYYLWKMQVIFELLNLRAKDKKDIIQINLSLLNKIFDMVKMTKPLRCWNIWHPYTLLHPCNHAIQECMFVFIKRLCLYWKITCSASFFLAAGSLPQLAILNLRQHPLQMHWSVLKVALQACMQSDIGYWI